MARVQDLAYRYALLADDQYECSIMGIFFELFVNRTSNAQLTRHQPVDEDESYLLITYFLREADPLRAARGPKMLLRNLPPIATFIMANVIPSTAHMSWNCAVVLINHLWHYIEEGDLNTTYDMVMLATPTFGFIS
jgi:hypothetical protein